MNGQKLRYMSILVVVLLAALLLGSCRTAMRLGMNETQRELLDLPTASGFSLAPDGSQVAWLDFWKGQMNLYVRTLDGEGAEQRRITSYRGDGVSSYMWLSPEVIRVSRDTAGNEQYESEFVTTGKIQYDPAEVFADIDGFIDVLPDEPHELLVAARENVQLDAYHLNAATGERELLVRNPGYIDRFESDQHGVVRFGWSGQRDGSTLWIREPDSTEFRTLLRTTSAGDVFSLLGYDRERDVVYAVSNLGLDRTSLVEVDAATGEVENILFEHPVVDIGGAWMPNGWDMPPLVRYDHDYPAYECIGEGLKGFAAAVDQQFPERVYTVTDVVPSGDVLFALYDGVIRDRVYIYNSDSDEISLVQDLGSGVNSEMFATQHAISYEARDGRAIHGYLSLPPGVEMTSARDLPVVVHVHGGPWHRDRWGLDYQNQLFGARGYAVLQVNFRGSSGYGREHLTAGNKQWGRAMQDDVTDGVHWLIDQGIADPDKIAIYGASYGGYAALAGATFTPELYAAAINVVGISNLFTLFLESSITQRNRYGRDLWHERVGHPNRDTELFREISPIYHVEQIQAPVMIIHGENDPRVPISQSLEMVRAMREADKEVEYHGRADEGHGFRGWNNIFDMFVRIDSFLMEHMPPE